MNRQNDDELVFSDRKTKHTNRESNAAYEELDDFIYIAPKKHHKKHSSSSYGYGTVKKHRRRWPKVVITLLCVLVALVLAAIATVAILINVGKGELLGDSNSIELDIPKTVDNSDSGKYITYNGEKYKYNENITSVLFMGVDKRTFNEGEELIGANGDADALILLAYDVKTAKANLISISREAMVDMDAYSVDGSFVGTKNQQICLAYAYGDGKEKSCENEVDAVKKLFYNIPINSYVALDLDGIGFINDAVDGVTLTSLDTFKNFKKDEVVTLYGDNAETYVRYRDTSQLDSNNSRMQRQKQYLNAFFNQLVKETKSDLTTVVDLYNVSSPYLVTNVGVGKAAYLASSVLQGSFGDFDMQNVPGTVTQGENYAEFNIDKDAFFELFLSVYYEKVS